MYSSMYNTINKKGLKVIEKKELMQQVLTLPDTHGVYIFRSSNGEYIYIGFSRKIRSRCMSHLLGQGGMFKASAIIGSSDIVEAIATRTIEEARALERKMIFEHKPKFNNLPIEHPDSRKRTLLVVEISKEHKAEVKSLAARRYETIKEWIYRAIAAAIVEEKKYD